MKVVYKRALPTIMTAKGIIKDIIPLNLCEGRHIVVAPALETEVRIKCPLDLSKKGMDR